MMKYFAPAVYLLNGFMFTLINSKPLLESNALKAPILLILIANIFLFATYSFRNFKIVNKKTFWSNLDWSLLILLIEIMIALILFLVKQDMLIINFSGILFGYWFLFFGFSQVLDLLREKSNSKSNT